MKQIINLALKSEYSFQKTHGYLDKIIDSQNDVVGIADINNTFAHYYLNKRCIEQDKKPIFGVRLTVVRNPQEKIKPRGQYGPEYIFIAKNHDGLIEIHKLVEKSIEMMYWRNHIGLIDVWGLSKNVIVIAPNFEIPERIDYIALGNTTSVSAMECDIPKVAIINNQYMNAEDKHMYQLFAGPRKRESFTYPTHILSTNEWFVEFGDEEAINNTHVIADMCNVEFPQAEAVKYQGKDNIRKLCEKGAKELGVNLKDKVYKIRLDRELKTIEEKEYTDYFMIVQEMIVKAKGDMLVGPARGSAAGSLVCYLLSITSIDPIKFGLLFERFIDKNRLDPPDIDIDFPDVKRKDVIDELIRTNGKDNVKTIATITKLQPKSAIGEFGKELKVDLHELDEMKANILPIKLGDSRYGNAIHHSYETDYGKKFIENNPAMELACQVENHARHSGVHAAGVIVATKPINHFASVNPKNGTMQLEGKPAEYMGLLKIDCLGLTTLTVLEEVAELAGFDFRDFYSLKLDDDKVFKIYRQELCKGIFQFEGGAQAGLTKTIKVKQFDDIAAMIALARPGPLASGGTKSFSDFHQGKSEVEYVLDDEDVKRITKSTLGVLVYQEQIMEVIRVVGGFKWTEVSRVRILMSKRSIKGEIEKFEKKFVKGAVKKGINKADAHEAWRKIETFAKYSFNKSHSVSYGIISYWTAWSKRYYPLEFLVASLNTDAATDNKKRLIREMIEHHKFKFISFDEKLSGERWRLEGKKIIGPLTNIVGIGDANARVIVRKRKTGEPNAESVQKKLDTATTKFDILYPAAHYWGDMFVNPSRYGLYEQPVTIKELAKRGKGEYILIARLMQKHVKDLNDITAVQKRGGEMLDDNTKLLDIKVEDDTEMITCRVNRFDFNKLGVQIEEEGEEEKDWYMIKGKIIDDEIIFMFVTEIFKLGDGFSKGQTMTDFRNVTN